MDAYTEDQLERFQEAVQSLKLYRRAELEGDQGEDLIEVLYVDPLPYDHVHNTLRRANTTFLIGRKGTGKSTIFLRAQKSVLKEKRVLSTYVDIKTVYESAQVNPSLLTELGRQNGALPEAALQQLLLMTSFLRALVSGIRDDLSKQLSSSWRLRVKESFTGSYADLSAKLEDFVATLDDPQFVSVQGFRTPHRRGMARLATEDGGGLRLDADTERGLSAGIDLSSTLAHSEETEEDYSDVLMRSINIQQLILALKELLEPLSIKHLYVFVDDFSELPLPAMRAVVDVLIAPLNNWSDELVKFKVAAYPGRIYYGSLDKSKIDEVSLDLHKLYGQTTVGDMEEKGVDFTRRLIEKRFEHFELSAETFIESRSAQAVWTALFQASLGNPRTLGYILVFIYESQVLYGRRITVSGVRDAARRYYEDKLEPYFNMGRFLHESFDERSTIFSLKELLENFVNRARALRSKESSSVFRKIEGYHPTSHFNVSPSFESLLSTLELNFFLTKYFEMSNKDGQKVSIYALNYGLCVKYNITFGRASDTRQLRTYLIERVFDYNSIIQDYIASNQEIRCDTCDSLFPYDRLQALLAYNMLCPECRTGKCEVTNISRKYEDLIRSVNSEQMLPSTELGILQTLSSEPKALFAADIAAEMDVSHQLVGRRAKRLAEQRLVERAMVRGRREFRLTDTAKRIYFDEGESSGLDLDGDQ